MPLEPAYGPGVDKQLDRIEFDPDQYKLWRAVVETINFVCANPDNPVTRRFAMRTSKDNVVWRVPIPSGSETENWCLIWQPDGEDALIFYVGPWPPSQH